MAINRKIEIVSIIENNPRKGLEMVFTQYADRLYGYCVSNWSFSEDDAWEIIYKTLETIIDSIKVYDFESQKHFENFLYKVYKNNLRQCYRKKRMQEKQFKFVSLEQEVIEQLDNSTNSLESIETFFQEIINENDEGENINSNSKLALLEKALDMLPESDKDILLLRGQNFTYNDIAKLLQIDNNQLKVKFHRAKKKLLQQILNLMEKKDEHK